MLIHIFESVHSNSFMSKYFFTLIYLLPLLVGFSLYTEGWWTFTTVVFFFVFVPILELFIKPDHSNWSKEMEAKLKADPFFDLIILLVIPMHIGLLIAFFFEIGETEFGSIAYFGKLSAVGIMSEIDSGKTQHDTNSA